MKESEYERIRELTIRKGKEYSMNQWFNQTINQKQIDKKEINNKEISPNVISQRKRKFGIFLLILVLLLNNINFFPSYAKDYTVEDANNILGEVVYPGDNITFQVSAGNGPRISFFDYGADLFDVPLYTIETEEIVAGSIEGNYTFTVKSYEEMGGSNADASLFKAWRIDDIYFSSGAVGYMYLTPLLYTSSPITYVLDPEAANDPANPSFYLEGKEEIILKPATKAGYEFKGWFTEPELTKQITSITTSHTGAITLYSKFEKLPSVYQITYHLEGGTNGVGNPEAYTEGVGVAGFADATKEGYQFEGWYKEASYTTKITEISPTETGNIELYAKFTLLPPTVYNITYHLDGGKNAATNPATYTKGVGVAGFADATKKGHQFEGWYSEAAFTTKITSITTEQTGDVVLYAKFVKKPPTQNPPKTPAQPPVNPEPPVEPQTPANPETSVPQEPANSTEQPSPVQESVINTPAVTVQPQPEVRVRDEVPKTGERSARNGWIFVAIFSGLGMLIMRLRKENKEQKDE